MGNKDTIKKYNERYKVAERKLTFSEWLRAEDNGYIVMTIFKVLLAITLCVALTISTDIHDPDVNYAVRKAICVLGLMDASTVDVGEDRKHKKRKGKYAATLVLLVYAVVLFIIAFS